MTLEILQAEMIAAMKNRDKDRKETISSLVSAIKKTAIDKMCKDSITEELVDSVILKEKKTVQEMIDTCPASREDLMEQYKFKMAVINEFAPSLITNTEEIANKITKILTTSDIEISTKNKGVIMKTIIPEFKGKADMKIVNNVVSELLSKSKDCP